MGFQNIFACLVHESQECVIDLVRNLRYMDPSSRILLYNGGKHSHLLDCYFPFERYGVVVHPRPRLMSWGRLHDFALDCMQFALENHPFDTLTIVDSDQLGMRSGYSDYLARFLHDQSEVGLLGCSPGIQAPNTEVGPAVAAYREIDLWRSFLRCFQNGEQKFVHWTFWPTTIFTAVAARELLNLFTKNGQLKDLMRRTRIWATEEVIFPTLVALLGFRVAANPCSYDYVKYGESYTPDQIDNAIGRPDVYWIHPVPRQYDNPLRRHIRNRFDHYIKGAPQTERMLAERSNNPHLLLRLPILTRMKKIEGWLEEDEAELLIAAASHALTESPALHAIVEVGSYCGRSTVVLGSAAKALNPKAKVYAIDPHQGKVGAIDQGITRRIPTLKIFRRNIAEANLTGVVQVIQKHSFDVDWDKPISLLLIDGLHDYINVARDFFHFESWIVSGGYILFHDYADYYPGVKAFVNELLSTGKYKKVVCVQSMVVVQRLFEHEQTEQGLLQEPLSHPTMGIPMAMVSTADSQDDTTEFACDRMPMVSCIMPTHNRREFVPQAIQYFLRQDYPDRELIIVDDGTDDVADLVPADPRILYLRLDRKHALGTKRNLACREAKGEVIVHWHDDDWHSPDRIRYQVQALVTGGAEVCGLDTRFFLDVVDNTFWSCTPALHAKMFFANVNGRSLMYSRRLWENYARYPDIPLTEDAQFLKNLLQRKVAFMRCDNTDKFIYIRHRSNSWRFNCGKFIAPKDWRVVGAPSFVPTEDILFYKCLPTRCSPAC